MLVTLLGIVMEVSDEQPMNVSTPMLVTLSGIVIEVSASQPKKALSPMLVTVYVIPWCVMDEGITTEVSV